MEVHQEKILYAKYYGTPAKFQLAIICFSNY